MSVVIIDLLFAAVVAILGAIGGWYLRGGRGHRERTRHEPGQESDERGPARGVLNALHELVTCVGADVREHSSRVEEITEELTSTKIEDPEIVVTAMAKLVMANDRLHQKLASAEEKLQQQARQIESHVALARTDPLTRLNNRRALDDEMARCSAEFQRHGRTFSVVMLDVDGFQQFNSALGHQAGDEVLRGLGGLLRDQVQDTEFLARYGGDEFVLVLPGASLADAQRCAERVRKAVDSSRSCYEGTTLHVTVGAGVAQVLPDEDPSAVIDRADAALYASKEAGPNCTHWHDGREIHPVPAKETAPPAEADLEDRQAEQPGREVEAPGSEIPASEVNPLPDEEAPPQPERPFAPAEDKPLVSCELPDEQRPTVSNRTAFCIAVGRRLAEWKRGGAPVSVILVQIDDYPAILSRHGQEAADSVVRVMTQFVTVAVREMDLVAHYDLAALAALLPGVALAGAMGVAERLRHAIAEARLPVDGGRLRISVSSGGAEVTTGDDTERLLRRTEEALRAAVESGGNCSFCHDGMRPEPARAVLGSTG